MPQERKDLNTAEVAAAMGVGVPTVRRWITKGVLPAAKVPGSRTYRIDPAAIAALRVPVVTG